LNLNNLNNEQLAAVTSPYSHTLVLAGAGTGKTTTLINRIVYLMNEHMVSGHNILCLTFTNKAAREMRERLAKHVPVNELQKIWLGTFHAICLRMLSETGYRLDYDEHIGVYDADESLDLLIQVNKEHGEPYKEGYLKKLNAKFSEEKPDLSEDELLIFRDYLFRLRKFNCVDYTRMMTEVIRLFREHPDIQELFHKKFQYVFIDEFQDTSEVQMLIYSMLEPENLFCVGDPDQLIYGWRNAKIEIILNFEKQFPVCNIVTLTKNYRSPPDIITAANNLIKHNHKRFDKRLESVQDFDGGFNTRHLPDIDKHDDAMVFALNRLKEDKPLVRSFEWGEMVIIARMNSTLERMFTRLYRAGIPAVLISSRKSIWNCAAAKEILNLLWLVYNPRDDLRMEKFFSKSLEMDYTTVRDIKKTSLNAGCAMSDVWIAKQGITEGQFPLLTGSLTEIVDQLFSQFQFKRRYENYLERKEQFFEVGSEIVEWAKDNDNSLKDFLHYIVLRSEQDSIDAKMSQDKVKLMTVHGAKGLEFPVVFVADCVDGKFPNSKSKDIEEERRTFYVAITRAQFALWCWSYAQSTNPFTHQMVIDLPSPFLKETGIH